MKRLTFYLVVILAVFLISCNSNIKLIDKYKAQNVSIKFYKENITKEDLNIKRIYASVDCSRNRSYYSFYPDRIVKTTSTDKALIYTVIYGQLPQIYDSNEYQKFSALDSLVLFQGVKLLDSLGLNNFKRLTGAEAFRIEVNYYHGYPKHKKFRP